LDSLLPDSPDYSLTALKEAVAMTSYMPIITNRQIDQILDEALRNFGPSVDWMPACNVWEDEEGFHVQAALAGWEPHQVSLEVNNHILTMKGERSMPPAEGRYHLQEIGGTSFSRALKLPASVDHGQGRATHKNGLLTISFPKREDAKPRRILIEA